MSDWVIDEEKLQTIDLLKNKYNYSSIFNFSRIVLFSWNLNFIFPCGTNQRKVSHLSTITFSKLTPEQDGKYVQS